MNVVALLISTFAFLIAESGGSGSQFQITDDEFGGLHLKVLRNSATGESASVIYDMGGRIESLELLATPRSSSLRPILWTHDRNATAARENESWRGQFLLPYASRVSRATYEFYSSTYHLPMNEPERGNALHGLLFNKTLAVLDQTADNRRAQLKLGYNFTGKDEGYPFLLGLTIDYVLEHNVLLNRSQFSVQLTFENHMPNAPLPLSVGWHPYFLSTVYKTRVTFDDCTHWNHVIWANNSNIDSSLIPTGLTNVWMNFTGEGNKSIGGTTTNPTYFDDEFKPIEDERTCALYRSRIYDPTAVGGGTIVLWQNSAFRFVHVYTGGRSRWGIDAVAVEPQSGMTNCFNNHDGLVILSGGQRWTGMFGIYIE